MKKKKKMAVNSEFVVLKYGGGLITFKDQECKANVENIDKVSDAVYKLIENNYRYFQIHVKIS